jgi:hypothetical protein
LCKIPQVKYAGRYLLSELILLQCDGTPDIFPHETDVLDDTVWCFYAAFSVTLFV